MKRYIAFLTAILTVSTLVWAGELRGMHEVSLSGQGGQLSSHEERTWDNGTLVSTQTSNDRTTFLTLALRYGWFVHKGLEFEPELHWFVQENVEPATSIHANAVYNLDLARKSGPPRALLFVLAGYGVGNAVPTVHSYFARRSDSFDVSVLNLGAGLKAFVSERIALRVEYRHQRYSHETEYASSGSRLEYKYTDNFSNIFFGFSIFFPSKGHSTASETGGCSGCGPAK